MSWHCERCGQYHDTASFPRSVGHIPIYLRLIADHPSPQFYTVDHGFAWTEALNRLAAAIEKLASALAGEDTDG